MPCCLLQSEYKVVLRGASHIPGLLVPHNGKQKARPRRSLQVLRPLTGCERHVGGMLRSNRTLSGWWSSRKRTRTGRCSSTGSCLRTSITGKEVRAVAMG